MSETKKNLPGARLLRQAMENRGHTPTEVAKTMGVSLSAVSRALSGKRGAGLTFALRAWEEYGVPMRAWEEEKSGTKVP